MFIFKDENNFNEALILLNNFDDPNKFLPKDFHQIGIGKYFYGEIMKDKPRNF
jgi:hypothetical protein